jgi:hypothetical protein
MARFDVRIVRPGAREDEVVFESERQVTFTGRKIEIEQHSRTFTVPTLPVVAASGDTVLIDCLLGEEPHTLHLRPLDDDARTTLNAFRASL